MDTVDTFDETEPHNKLMLSLFDNLDKSVEEQIQNLSDILLENSHVLPIEMQDHHLVRELACRIDNTCILTCIDFILRNTYNYHCLYNYLLRIPRNILIDFPLDESIWLNYPNGRVRLRYYQYSHCITSCTRCNNNIRYYRALIALRRLDKTIPDYTTGSWNERKYAVIGQWI